MRIFRCSTEIVSGDRALDQLRSVEAGSVLLVTDAFFSQNGIAMEIACRIKGACVHLFDRAVPDPSAELAAEGAAFCNACKPEVLLAVGGGSVMDCAKGIRAAYEGSVRFIAVPTTSGSGSEMTSFAILTRGDVKYPLVDEALRPDLAILDGQLLRNLPPSLIADTGMDLLAHCLEALVAINRSEFTDALAIHGAGSVFRYLERSFCGDASVRLNLHEAASMAGLAFDHAGLGLCHALAHAMGGLIHLPHGRLCAMLLPHVIAYNASAVSDRYAHLARSCGLTGVSDHFALRSLLGELQRLRRVLSLPAHLGQAGVAVSQWQQCKEAVMAAALADPCGKTNPVPVTRQAVETVLKAVAP